MDDRTVTEIGIPGTFYECPRWHDGEWWVSDMRGNAVFRFSAEGDLREKIALDVRPGGLGWTPEGDLLFVAMDEKKVLRRKPGGEISQWADLSALPGDIAGFCNDMTVGPDGTAYVGFDAEYLKYEEDFGLLIRVDPQGNASIAARKRAMPNGILFAPDGKSLILAETTLYKFTRFALRADGSLGEESLWGDFTQPEDRRASQEPPLKGMPMCPDGCDIDAEGNIWVANARADCLLVAPGGAVIDAVVLPDDLIAFACALGGEDGRTLLICGADAGRKASRLFTIRVDVPAA